MTEELILSLTAQDLATDSVTLHIGYDRSGLDRPRSKAVPASSAIHIDHYGRAVPRPAHGTARLESPTSSASQILPAVLLLFDRIVDPGLPVRRVTVTANRVVSDAYTQFDLFSDPAKQEKEKRLQRTMLEIKKKYGKNAILKGTSLLEGATTIERNGQIGGHRA